MNAVPMKPKVALSETLDDLIADHGLRPVILGLLGRLAKRTRPPDTKVKPRRGPAPRLDQINDHMRADLGLPPLPPLPPHRAGGDLHLLLHRHY